MKKEANITFKLTQNEDRITYIHCGNNLDTNGNALPGIQYENQFRFNSEDDMNRTFTIKPMLIPLLRLHLNTKNFLHQ